MISILVSLILGIIVGWFIRSFQLSRYFGWVLLSSLEFGGSDDELRAYKEVFERSANCLPKFMRRLLWIGNN